LFTDPIGYSGVEGAVVLGVVMTGVTMMVVGRVIPPGWTILPGINANYYTPHNAYKEICVLYKKVYIRET